MTFDIHLPDEIDDLEDELEKYRDKLIKLFADSPEGQAHAKINPDLGFWTGNLIYYSNQFVGVSIPQMEEHHMEELLTDIFPRKISLSTPEEADLVMPEMIAFWNYLKREYKLVNADQILNYLHSVKQKDFRNWMNDSSRFGMAKSFFTMGQSAGFDMTNPDELDTFVNAYNLSRAFSRNSNVLPTSEQSARNKKDVAKVKRLRKIAQNSRKKNRKRK